MVSLLLSKIGRPEGFAPIPSSGELPREGKLHRSYSQGMGFQIFLCFENILRNEGFYGGRSANPATNLRKKSHPTAGGRPQTQLSTRTVGSEGAPPPFPFQGTHVCTMRGVCLCVCVSPFFSEIAQRIFIRLFEVHQ